mgnify:CR=1 FL=1
MNFLSQNWEAIAAVLGTLITGVVSFLGGRKSKKIIEQDQQASALQNMQSAYDKFTEQTNKQIDRLIQEFDSVKLENRDQRLALTALQKDNSKLHIEISKLMTKNNELNLALMKLQRENDSLKLKS